MEQRTHSFLYFSPSPHPPTVPLYSENKLSVSVENQVSSSLTSQLPPHPTVTSSTCDSCPVLSPNPQTQEIYSTHLLMGSQLKKECQLTNPLPGNKKMSRQHGGLGGSPPIYLLYLRALAWYLILPPCPQCSLFPTFWCSLCCWKNFVNSSHQ